MPWLIIEEKFIQTKFKAQSYRIICSDNEIKLKIDD